MQTLDQKTINEIKQRLIETYHPREIYMLEPQQTDANVDIDILVVVDQAGLQQRYAMMAEGHKALIGIKVPKNILVYTKEEFEDYLNDASTLSYAIKHYGKRIYAETHQTFSAICARKTFLSILPVAVAGSSFVSQ
jgi:hypothetical protein